MGLENIVIKIKKTGWMNIFVFCMVGLFFPGTGLASEREYKKLVKQVYKKPETADYQAIYKAYIKTLDNNRLIEYSNLITEIIFESSKPGGCDKVLKLTKKVLKEHFISVTAHLSSMQCYEELKKTDKANFHEGVMSNLLPLLLQNSGEDAQSALKIVSLADVPIIIQMLGYEMLDSMIEMTKGGMSFRYLALVNDPATGQQKYIYFENEDALGKIMLDLEKGLADSINEDLRGFYVMLGAAQIGEPHAQIAMGDWLQSSRYLSEVKDYIKNYYAGAAKQGSVIAHVRLAKEALRSGSETGYEEAISYLLPAIEKGFSEAEIMMAGLYRFGFGVEVDTEASELLMNSANSKFGAEKTSHLYGQYLLRYFEDEVDLKDEAVASLTKAANANYIPAINNLAAYYRENKKYNDAIEWYVKSSGLGSAHAQTALGEIYFWGYDKIEPDYEKALSWFGEAANVSHPSAQYWVGRIYEIGGVKGNVDAMLIWYQKAAGSGNEYAQSRLGWFRETGTHLKKDYKKAFSWYQLSAAQGNTYAEHALGVFFENGRGVEKNIRVAAQYYLKAAIKNHSGAATQLGWFFQSGMLGEKDYKQAVFWYEVAAKNGYARAQTNLAWLYDKGFGVKQDYQKAMDLYLKAAEQEYARAQNNIGWMYKNGNGVKVDYEKAVYWYKKAAENGSDAGQVNLGWAYGNGLGVEKNHELAFKWYQKAALQNNARAQNNLGSMYQGGRGVEKDINAAKKWYLKSANQGDELAQSNIASLYKEGLIGRKNNINQAIYWYQKAAEQGHIGAQKNLAALYLMKGEIDKATYWLGKVKSINDELKLALKQIECGNRTNKDETRDLAGDQGQCLKQHSLESDEYQKCLTDLGWSKLSPGECEDVQFLNVETEDVVKVEISE